jgi:ADP-ribosylglycohydrolase
MECMPRDDDIDFTILGLHVLEQYGVDFTSDDIAAVWLTHLPYKKVYTAERVAYRNLVNGLAPPQTATFRNPYREWIGAQIRADAYGYIAPGLPEAAASLAHRDASLTHVKNGIYGEMFVAAMVAAAFSVEDVQVVVQVGLSEIPVRSRLAEAVRKVQCLHAEYPKWEDGWEAVNRGFGGYSWLHTINNAAAVVLALLYGEGDFERSITIAVMSGWDTDCNGATVGSIIGAMKGASAISAKWVEPLKDRIRSDVTGYDNARISDLAQRTMVLASLARERLVGTQSGARR